MCPGASFPASSWRSSSRLRSAKNPLLGLVQDLVQDLGLVQVQELELGHLYLALKIQSSVRRFQKQTLPYVHHIKQ